MVRYAAIPDCHPVVDESDVLTLLIAGNTVGAAGLAVVSRDELPPATIEGYRQPSAFLAGGGAPPAAVFFFSGVTFRAQAIDGFFSRCFWSCTQRFRRGHDKPTR